MTEQPAKRTGIRAWWPFPGIVFALIGMSMTMATVTVVLATNDPSFGLEEDYFAKAVAWDETAEQTELNAQLGWKADVTLAADLDGRGDRAVTVLLTDSDGNAVEGATLEAFCFHNARRKETFEFGFTEIAPGRYSAGQPMARDGRWTVRLRATVGDTVFTHTSHTWTKVDQVNTELFPLIGAVLTASVLGSLHCAGMCGAFIALAVGVGQETPVSKVRLQSAYHLGRLVVYSLIGASFGVAGQAIDLGGRAVGLHKAAVMLAAATMITMGLVSLLRIAGVKVPKPASPGVMHRLFIRLHGVASKLTPTKRSLVIGLMTGLLPCGWLYAFALVAAGTAHPIAGALTMAAFWVGTLPVMVAVGTGVQTISGSLRRYIPAAMAITIVTMGVLTALGRTGHMLPTHDRAAAMTKLNDEVIDVAGQ